MPAYSFLNQPYAGTWQYAGVSGGIPTGLTVYQTIMTTGDNTDRSAAIQSAIDNCTVGQCVRIVGYCRVTSGLVLKAGKQLYTSVSDAGRIDFRQASGYGITFNGGDVGDPNYEWPGTPQTISSAVTAGTTTYTIPSATDFTVGCYARVEVQDQQNNTAITAGAYPVIDINSSRTYNRSFICYVTAKTSTTVTVTPPLPGTYTGLTCRLRPGNSVLAGAGIYGLELDSDNGPTNKAPINWASGVDCYLYRCSIKHGVAAYGLQFNNMHRLTVQRCHIRGIPLASRSSNGAGIMFGSQGSGITSALVLDNIIEQSFPNLEINFGSSMNVFAYNYFYDSGVTGLSGGSVLEHGAHNCFNLHEGNQGPNIEPDGYFGSSSESTIFRNRYTGTNPSNSDRATALLKRFTRGWQIIDNQFEGSISPYAEVGTPNIGSGATGSPTINNLSGQYWADWPTVAGVSGYQEQDATVVASCTFKGNTYGGSLISGESLSGDTLPDSLFLAAKPSWFFGLSYPLVNGSITTASTPAGYRFLNGDNNDPPAAGGGGKVMGGKLTVGGKVTGL